MQSTLAIANQTANGVLGTAANLDTISSFDITQTTAGIALTLPVPTNVQGKVRLNVSSNSASTALFTVQGVTIPIGGEMQFYYDTAWHVSGDPSPIDVRKFSVQQALVSGSNTITHSFGLTTPFAVQVEVRDVATGQWIDHVVMPSARTANAIAVVVGGAVTNAEIIVMG